MLEQPPRKVVFAGDSGVGKTSLIHAICGMSTSVVPTIQGQSFRVELSSEGQSVSFEIWDTAGQEQYQAITPVYFRGADVGIFVFSVDDRQSFENIDAWVGLVSNILSLPSTFILANKYDAPNHVVETEELENLASRLNATGIEVSAVNGYQLELLKQELVKSATTRAEGAVVEPKPVTIDPVVPEQKDACSPCGIARMGLRL
jgi:Ras-related protein Rab-8A